MPKKFTARCKCCKLIHQFTQRVGSESSGHHCTTCRYHQSQESNQTLKRHQEHEEMLREHLDSADTWAQRVEAENKKVKQDVYFAYRTRDRAADFLQKINDIHAMRPDGACSCGVKKNCPTAEIIYKPFAQRLIKNADDAQEEVRRKQERMREWDAIDGYEDDEWIRSTAFGPDRVTRRDDVAG